MDLLAEVCASTTAMKSVTESALAVAKFINMPKVKAILEELVDSKQLTPPQPACIVPDRPNEAVFDLLQSVDAHKEFLKALRHHQAFTTYYDNCPADEKETMFNVLNDLTPTFFKKLNIAKRWFDVIKHARDVALDPTFPMSAYLPLVQALKNELNEVFRDDPNFDATMGEGASGVLAEVLRTRFNMDGSVPADGQVGLLVKLQVWAFMVDPNKNLLTPGVALEGGLARHLSEMLQFFVPEYDQNSVIAKRRQLRQVFTEIHNQQGDWVYCFDSPAPPPLTAEEAAAAQEGLTINQVSQWIDQTGGQSSPLLFFAQMPRIEYYTLIAEPLLSMRTMGSLQADTVSAPLENKAKITKKEDMEKAETLLRTGLNVRFLFDANNGIITKVVKKTTTPGNTSRVNVLAV